MLSPPSAATDPDCATEPPAKRSRSGRLIRAPQQFRFEDFPDDAEVLREERLWESGKVHDTDNDYYSAPPRTADGECACDESCDLDECECECHDDDSELDDFIVSDDALDEDDVDPGEASDGDEEEEEDDDDDNDDYDDDDDGYDEELDPALLESDSDNNGSDVSDIDDEDDQDEDEVEDGVEDEVEEVDDEVEEAINEAIVDANNHENERAASSDP